MALTYITKFKKFLLANIENVIFNVSTTFTSLVLVLCSIYTFSLLFSGGFMQCVIPGGKSYGDLDPFGKFCFNARSTKLLANTTQNVIDHDYKEIIHHNIYISTPYILLVQAFLFFLPKFLLTHLERDTFKLAMYSFVDFNTPSREKREIKLLRAYCDFTDRLRARNHVAIGPILCEILNVVFIAFQIYVMHIYLATKFYEDVYSGNPFDVVFPKTMQCAYHGVEVNGTLGDNVASCDLPINYANENIFTYLWIWANLLMGLTTLVIIYRYLTMELYCCWDTFNRFELERVCTGPVKEGNLMVVTEWGFSTWLTIRRLGGELNGEDFSLLITLMEKIVESEDTDESQHTE